MHSSTPLPHFVVSPLDRRLSVELQHKIDHKTKPLGALGRLEPLALQIGLIQQTLSPRLRQPHLLVCAGDHGAAKVGVSAYPQEVTWQMVENFLAGGAAINVFSGLAGLRLVVADAGVAHDFGPRAGLVNAKISATGTLNYLEGPAMSVDQCAAAMTKGATLVHEFAALGCNVLAFGEMGIGNTASAALITHCLTGLSLTDCVGRGTGLDDAGLERKRILLAQALSVWTDRESVIQNPEAVLARFGGFEIAMLCGAMLAAAEARMTLLIDGFIVTSALLVAAKLAPAVLDYCVYSHCSNEAGHCLQLDALKATPLLDLGLRLGEGTGAALALPLLRAACAFMNDMASFEAAGVSGKCESAST